MHVLPNQKCANGVAHDVDADRRADIRTDNVGAITVTEQHMHLHRRTNIPGHHRLLACARAKPLRDNDECDHKLQHIVLYRHVLADAVTDGVADHIRGTDGCADVARAHTWAVCDSDLVEPDLGADPVQHRLRGA